MNSSEKTVPMHLFTSFSNVTYITVQSKLRRLIILGSSGQLCLKYQFMITQTERESNKSCRTGDSKCVPISKARGGGSRIT